MLLLTCSLEWNNSRRPSVKCAKCSACANSVGTLSRRRTRARLACCRPMIQRGSAAGTARWRVVADRKVLQLHSLFSRGKGRVCAGCFGGTLRIDVCMYMGEMVI